MSRTTRDLGALVLSRGAPVTLAAGHTLFAEGDRSASVYACRSGRLKVSVSTPSGDELLLGWKGPGDGFGELSAIDGAPRSARVTAAEDSELARLGRSEFLGALRTRPDLAVDLLIELSAHLRRANDRVVAARSSRIPVRVGQCLLDLTAKLERHGGVVERFQVEITQDDLAGWVGATRESTARALATFRRQGWVETARGRIVVVDRPALERLVLDPGD